MNTEKIRDILKKLRDLILCCKKTIDEVKSIIEEVNKLKFSKQPTRIYNL